MNLFDTSILLAKHGTDSFENPSAETAASAGCDHWEGFMCSPGSTVSAITALDSTSAPINGITDLTSITGFIPCRFTSISGTGSFTCVRSA